MTPKKTVMILTFVRVVQRAAGAEVGAPVLAVGDGDVLDRHVREGRQQVRPHDRAVVAQLRRPALALVQQPVEIVLARLGEGHAGADHSGKRAAAGLREDAAEPLLGGAAGQRAGRRAAAAGVRGADALLDLAAVGQAVLRVPDRATLAVAEEDMAGRLGARTHAR
jgi:hypothetical protein